MSLPIRAANAAMLLLCGVESVVLMASFLRSTLSSKATRLFFIQAAVTSVTMFAYALSFIHHPDPHDWLYIAAISIAYIGFYTILYLYIRYLISQIHMRERVPESISYISLVICVISSMIWIIFSSVPGLMIYEESISMRNETFWIAHTGSILLILISLWLLYRYRKSLGNREVLILGSMPVLLLAAILLKPFTAGINLSYPCVMLELLIIYTQHHLNVEGAVARNSADALRARLALASGRIKPHYLYNVLTTIYYLCDSDPQKAQEAIGSFSEYLRNTMETVDRSDHVEFSWELAQIRHYLSLEKLRFGDRLRVVYDTEVDKFKLPPLTIEPLVENAVRHGISPKAEGGTVRITSKAVSGGGAQIQVIDDGVGFDVSTIHNQDPSEDGLSTLRERLRLECGADMMISSSPVKGTVVTVTIYPQESTA